MQASSAALVGVLASSGALLPTPVAKRGGTPACAASAAVDLYDPAARDAHYKANIAQYLVDLHDADATFDFCGGMMFQLILSPTLRNYLAGVAGEHFFFL